MKKNAVLSFSVLAVLMFVFTSCGKLPQVEIDAANAAITEAQVAQADVYVPAEFNALKDSMNAAMENIEVQKSKLFKSYKASKEQLLSVTVLAGNVKVSSENKIAELKAQIQTTLTEIATLNEENKTLVAAAPKGKGGTSVLMAIKGEIATIDTALAEVSATAETENFNVTLQKASAVKEQALGINTELKSVIEKYNSRK